MALYVYIFRCEVNQQEGHNVHVHIGRTSTRAFFREWSCCYLSIYLWAVARNRKRVDWINGCGCGIQI